MLPPLPANATQMHPGHVYLGRGGTFQTNPNNNNELCANALEHEGIWDRARRFLIGDYENLSYSTRWNSETMRLNSSPGVLNVPWDMPNPPPGYIIWGEGHPEAAELPIFCCAWEAGSWGDPSTFTPSRINVIYAFPARALAVENIRPFPDFFERDGIQYRNDGTFTFQVTAELIQPAYPQPATLVFPPLPEGLPALPPNTRYLGIGPIGREIQNGYSWAEAQDRWEGGGGGGDYGCYWEGTSDSLHYAEVIPAAQQGIAIAQQSLDEAIANHIATHIDPRRGPQGLHSIPQGWDAVNTDVRPDQMSPVQPAPLLSLPEVPFGTPPPPAGSIYIGRGGEFTIIGGTTNLECFHPVMWTNWSQENIRAGNSTYHFAVPAGVRIESVISHIGGVPINQFNLQGTYGGTATPTPANQVAPTQVPTSQVPLQVEFRGHMLPGYAGAVDAGWLYIGQVHQDGCVFPGIKGILRGVTNEYFQTGRVEDWGGVSQTFPDQEFHYLAKIEGNEEFWAAFLPHCPKAPKRGADGSILPEHPLWIALVDDKETPEDKLEEALSSYCVGEVKSVIAKITSATYEQAPKLGLALTEPIVALLVTFKRIEHVEPTTVSALF